MESRCKCKNDKAKKSYKVLKLDEKIKILDKLRSALSATAVGLTCR
jgi:Zn-finger domain-containing protein